MALKLAVLSTSRIVVEFMRHCGDMPEIQVTALCCRPQSRARAEELARAAGVERIYTDEDECYAAGGFDAVYIGTANHLHYAAAKKALEAGYHVILEKPFTPTAAEARALFELADQKGRVLFEAITTHYLPSYAFLRGMLPAIGPVRGAMASFCARSARYDDFLKGVWNTTFDPACNGGALYDMNVYNLHFFYGLLGKPDACEYRPSLAENGVDTAGLAVLHYGDVSAAALAAKDSEGEKFACLQGPGGSLHLHGGTNSLDRVYAVLGGVRGGGQRTDGPVAQRHRMAYEFAEFARIVEQGDAAAEAGARRRTLDVMDMIDALRATAPRMA